PFSSKFHARDHRRQRPHPVVHAGGRPSRGGSNPLRRAFVGAAFRPDCRSRHGVPGPPWSWPHHSAPPGELPRQCLGAEIDRRERDGATLVGMTGMPEAALAREQALPYVAIAVVVNHAAGRADSADAISMDGIARVLETAMDKVRALLEHVVPLVELP